MALLSQRGGRRYGLSGSGNEATDTVAAIVASDEFRTVQLSDARARLAAASAALPFVSVVRPDIQVADTGLQERIAEAARIADAERAAVFAKRSAEDQALRDIANGAPTTRQSIVVAFKDGVNPKSAVESLNPNGRNPMGVSLGRSNGDAWLIEFNGDAGGAVADMWVSMFKMIPSVRYAERNAIMTSLPVSVTGATSSEEVAEQPLTTIAVSESPRTEPAASSGPSATTIAIAIALAFGAYKLMKKRG